jgi:Mrp family chromosome partitioning ATPase
MAAADRYVVLGLARVRAPWFGDVARWATSAALPVDFVKVVSAEEARARLRSGRPFSALLVDAGLSALDRDLVEVAWRYGCVVVAVDDGRSTRSWSDLGVQAVLPAAFERDQLLDALRAVARPLSRGDELAVPTQPAGEPAARSWRGWLVAVTGAGGVGRSTLAMALATGLAADPRDRGLVVVADLALDGHQALLHDAGDVVPGLLELVEAHRAAGLPPEQVRELCFTVPDRGYDVLLGLRRHRDWTAVRPRALDAALDGLRGAYRLVVADVDADVEGEQQCGSIDVEDRNALARHTLTQADLVLVVGQAGVAGVHAHLRVARDLLELGLAPGRLLPVVNRAPRNPRQRAEAGSAFTRLLGATNPGVILAAGPVHLPERRRVGELVRDNAPPPAPLVKPLTGAVRALLDRARQRGADPPAAEVAEPVPVVPGTLGSWADDEVAT